MIELAEDVVVARPQAAVFAHLARIEALPDWLPGVREAQLLDPPPAGPGSRLRLAIDGPTGPLAATGELTELRAPVALAFRTVEAPVQLEARCDLEAIDAGRTRVRLGGRLTLPGMLRFAEGMVRRQIDERRAAAIADLRGRLESAIPG